MADGGARCTGAILVGGAAARFGGTPKGLERVGGRRVLDRVHDALRQVSDEVALVGAGAASRWLRDVAVLGDAEAGAGPLGGLVAALRHGGGDVLLVAWDMPFLSPTLLGELRRVGERSRATAVVPESDASGRLEPLCAWYGRDCAAAAAEALAAGTFRMTALLERVGAHRLPHARVLDFGDPQRLFHDVDTPDDLALAERLATPPIA